MRLRCFYGVRIAPLIFIAFNAESTLERIGNKTQVILLVFPSQMPKQQTFKFTNAYIPRIGLAGSQKQISSYLFKYIYIATCFPRVSLNA